MERLRGLVVTSVGGQYNYPVLTKTLPEEEYAKAKIHMWLYMLNDGRKPVKWLKPTGKGTKVNFEVVRNQEDYDAGLVKLIAFVEEMNAKFGFDFKISKSED